MRRREFIGLVGGAVTWPLATRAQQPKKIPRIGVLWQGASAATHPYYQVLRDGFKAVGYAEGDLIFEDRFFDKNLEKVDLLAKELVDLKCDVLIGVTARQPWHFEGQQAPFFFSSPSSFNHPGGNVTGVTHVGTDVAAKRVELLRDTIPGLSSVALIWDTSPAIQIHHPCRTGGYPKNGKPAWTVI